MKFVLFLSVLVLVTACSMAPNQNRHQSNSNPNNIRIIKEQPKQYEYHKKYNSKIEQVEYNSSIITPEIESNGNKERKNTKKVDAERVKNRVSHTIESKTNSAVNGTIDKGVDTLLR